MLDCILRRQGRISEILRVLSGTPTLIVATIQALNSIANFFVALFLARKVGLAALGEFSLYFTIGTSLSAVLTALICQPLVSIASQKSPLGKALYEYAVNKFVMRTTIFVMAACIFTIVASHLDTIFLPVALGLAMSVGVTSAEFSRRVGIFSGHEKQVLISDALRVLIIAISFYIIQYNDAPSSYYVYIYGAASTLFSVGLARSLKLASSRILTPPMNSVILIRLLKSGRWLALLAMLQFLSSHALIIASFFLLGAGPSGIIRVAQTLVGLLNPALQGLENLMPKKFGKMVNELGMQEAIIRYRLLRRRVLAPFLFLGAGIALISAPLLEIFSIKDNVPAQIVLILFMTAYLITMAYNLRLVSNRAFLNMRSPLYWSVAATAIGLAAMWPFLNQFGMIGLAILLNLVRVIPLIGLHVNLARKPG